MSTYEDRMEAHERLAWCADNPEIVDAMRAELFGPAPIASGGDGEVVAAVREIADELAASVDEEDDYVDPYETGGMMRRWANHLHAIAARLERR